jgi:hypothetical protein
MPRIAAPLLAVATLVAVVWSCGGPVRHDSGLPPGHTVSSGSGDGGQDGGDGGSDGGDGGSDGGSDGGDGGCAGPLARPIDHAFDGCFSAGQEQSAELQALVCDATLYIATAQVCTGKLDGGLNAFTGTCQSLNCAAPQLPGTITCALGDGGSCTIRACTIFGDAGCGP